jgi:hypothetical protein
LIMIARRLHHCRRDFLPSLREAVGRGRGHMR